MLKISDHVNVNHENHANMKEPHENDTFVIFDIDNKEVVLIRTTNGVMQYELEIVPLDSIIRRSSLVIEDTGLCVIEKWVKSYSCLSSGDIVEFTQKGKLSAGEDCDKYVYAVYSQSGGEVNLVRTNGGQVSTELIIVDRVEMVRIPTSPSVGKSIITAYEDAIKGPEDSKVTQLKIAHNDTVLSKDFCKRWLIPKYVVDVYEEMGLFGKNINWLINNVKGDKFSAFQTLNAIQVLINDKTIEKVLNDDGVIVKRDLTVSEKVQMGYSPEKACHLSFKLNRKGHPLTVLDQDGDIYTEYEYNLRGDITNVSLPQHGIVLKPKYRLHNEKMICVEVRITTGVFGIDQPCRIIEN